MTDELFPQFEAAYCATGAITIPEDFTEAFWEWRVLDGLQKLAAIEALKTFKAAGGDPAYLKRPARYLKTREWKRPIAQKQSKLERLIADA